MATIHNETYRELVRRLTDLRRQSGLSQKALSEALGLEQPDISKIETFERRLDALELLGWLNAVSPDRYKAVMSSLLEMEEVNGQ